MTLTVIRPVVPDDIEIFYQQQLDEEACRMANFPSRSREAVLSHWANIMRNPNLYNRTIEHNGEVAGNVLCYPLDDMMQVGYWLGRSFWGKGIATQALQLALAEITHRPLHAYVALQNIGSQRVLIKCGFVQCGVEGDELLFRLD